MCGPSSADFDTPQPSNPPTRPQGVWQPSQSTPKYPNVAPILPYDGPAFKAQGELGCWVYSGGMLFLLCLEGMLSTALAPEMGAGYFSVGLHCMCWAGCASQVLTMDGVLWWCKLCAPRAPFGLCLVHRMWGLIGPLTHAHPKRWNTLKDIFVDG